MVSLTGIEPITQNYQTDCCSEEERSNSAAQMQLLGQSSSLGAYSESSQVIVMNVQCSS